jgi:hypothetical protein
VHLNSIRICLPSGLGPLAKNMLRGTGLIKIQSQGFRTRNFLPISKTSVAEQHHFYAAPAQGENFDAAPAPAPTLLYV